MKRRITTFLLAVCMTVSLLAVPAGAASGATVTFSDIGDRSTAMAVESLRLLGCWTATATAPSARARC